MIDAWLPVGFQLPDDRRAGGVVCAGLDWQILDVRGGGRALVVEPALTARWRADGLIGESTFTPFSFGERQLVALLSATTQALCPLPAAGSPQHHTEALAFAVAFKATRARVAEVDLGDALYVEKLQRLLPTYGLAPVTADALVLGRWLTGGLNVSASSFQQLRRTMGWLGAEALREVIEAAGVAINAGEDDAGPEPARSRRANRESSPDNRPVGYDRTPDANRQRPFPEGEGLAGGQPFALAGRPALSAFFNEHVVDVVRHRERYRALGVGFPAAMILHGPPGCGKTFAVEQLVDFLGWPSFQIDASSVASSYIHETSRKVAQVFQDAMNSAPAVLVIDEMEAFLADRNLGAGASHHRVEEMAEFLRRIPEAVRSDVLVVAMTNRLDMIDPAIQRRGRFDHIIGVDFASEEEVRALLDSLLATLPTEPDVDSGPLAAELAGRPLSDVAFVVREGARLTARAGRTQLDQASLRDALAATQARAREGASTRRVGFLSP